MRCALIKDDVESPLGRRTGHGRATSKARRIIRARATNTHPVTFLLRATQGLRIMTICNALAVYPASCFRVGHQECLHPLPARQMLAFGLRFSLHHSEKKSGDTRYGQVNDLRCHIPIPGLHRLRSSDSRKASQHKDEVFCHTSAIYPLTRRTQLNAFARQTVMSPGTIVPNGLRRRARRRVTLPYGRLPPNIHTARPAGSL
jgi:hypothetical protein